MRDLSTIDRAARVLCDIAHHNGLELHDWDDAGENTRDLYRLMASAAADELRRSEGAEAPGLDENGLGAAAGDGLERANDDLVVRLRAENSFRLTGDLGDGERSIVLMTEAERRAEAADEIELLRALDAVGPTDDDLNVLIDESYRLLQAREAWAELDRLLEHWCECPAPPDGGCDDCHRWFGARGELRDALGDGKAKSSGDVVEQGFVRPARCVCALFGDTGGYRIADLTCPRHGVDGDVPGDGLWERSQDPPSAAEPSLDGSSLPS